MKPSPFDTIEAALTEIKRTIEAVETRHSQKLAERRRLLELPAPPDEVIANLRLLVTAQVERLRSERLIGLIKACSGGFEQQSHRIDEHETVTMHQPAAPQLPDGLMFHDLKTWEVIALASPVVGPLLEAFIKSEVYTYGPPMSERPALLATIDQAIRADEDEHERLVEAASSHGFPLSHLPAVRERREAAARRAAEQARIDEAQARQIQELEQQVAIGVAGHGSHETLSRMRAARFGRSEYLNHGGTLRP